MRLARTLVLLSLVSLSIGLPAEAKAADIIIGWCGTGGSGVAATIGNPPGPFYSVRFVGYFECSVKLRRITSLGAMLYTYPGLTGEAVGSSVDCSSCANATSKGKFDMAVPGSRHYLLYTVYAYAPTGAKFGPPPSNCVRSADQTQMQCDYAAVITATR